MQEDSDLPWELGKGCCRDPLLGRAEINYFSITEATCTQFKDQLLRLLGFEMGLLPGGASV